MYWQKTKKKKYIKLNSFCAFRLETVVWQTTEIWVARLFTFYRLTFKRLDDMKLQAIIHLSTCGLRHEDPTCTPCCTTTPWAGVVQISKKTLVLLLWRKRHVLMRVPVWKVSWKSPFRCKISPYFAKKSRLKCFLWSKVKF
jgi:hypothetical protein